MSPDKKNDLELGQNVNEKLFSLLISSVKDYAIFMLDPNGYVTSWNKGAENIKGYREKEIIGKHMSVFYTPADIEKKEPQYNLKEALKKGSYESEGWRVRKDCSTFWANVVFTPLYDDNEKLLGFAKVTRDITERKKEEDKKTELNAGLERQVKENTEKIITNELLFRALIENTHDGIVLLDKNNHTIFRSKSAERINGWTTPEMEQKGLTDVVHPDDKHIVANQMQAAIVQPHVPVYSTYRLLHKQGHYIWIECLFTNMLDDPNIKAIVSNFRDITYKKIGEELLEESRIKLQTAFDMQTAILNALPASIALLNTHGEIVSVNEAWKKFAASNNLKTPNYGIGYNYISIAERATGIDKKTGNRIAKGIKDVIAGTKKDFTIEYPCDSPNEKRWFQALIAPLDDHTHKGVVVLHINITDRKASEIKLNEVNTNLQKHAKELAISNAELEQFAYVASHDLQEPLRMVTSFLTQLEKKYAEVIDAKGKQYIHFAVDGAKRMRQIILDLLDFSRVGRTEDNLEEVDFNELINDILHLYRRSIDELQANIRFKNLPSIEIYSTPIRQVFQNLISNSLKYHKRDMAPVIDITCRETKQHFEFAVADKGIGVDSEYYDKIFIIFQRLHNKEDYSGTGMGLAISKKIIENLGGKIWVESVVGQGSTFYFTLLKNQRKL